MLVQLLHLLFQARQHLPEEEKEIFFSELLLQEALESESPATESPVTESQTTESQTTEDIFHVLAEAEKKLLLEDILSRETTTTSSLVNLSNNAFIISFDKNFMQIFIL